MARPAVTVEGDAIGHYDGPDWIQREIGGTPPPFKLEPTALCAFLRPEGRGYRNGMNSGWSFCGTLRPMMMPCWVPILAFHGTACQAANEATLGEQEQDRGRQGH